MKKLTLTCLIALLGLSVYFPVTKVQADSNADAEIEISITPNDYLFNISNMKPGDWAPRTVVVSNNGRADFYYQMILRNDGPEELFNELLLEINDADTELYSGKLADFKEIPARKLVASSQEELHVTVRFPEHLGNEFQGLSTKFSLIFSAVGEEKQKDTEIISGDIDSGGKIPKTGTNIFNYVLLGGILLASGGLIGLYRMGMKRLEKQRV